MQVYNLVYKDNKELESFISMHKIQENEHILIQIFTGNINPDYFMPLSKTIKRILPQATLIGATTCGEILAGDMLEFSTVISFSLFEKTIVKSMFCSFEDKVSFEEINKHLYTSDTKGLIVLSDGLKSDTELFINELHKINSDVVISGGRAADNAKFEKTYVFTDEVYTDNGAVLASLNSEALFIRSEYILNWTPIGKEMVVTKCNGNILYELDNIPVVELYRKYLGEDIVENLPSSCMPFPLITIKDNIEVARDPICLLDDGAMMYAGHFEIGDSFRFSFANIGDLTDNLKEAFDSYDVYPSEAIYIYSCAARKGILGKTLLDELHLIESLAPSVGFFTYGEFYQSHKLSELLNVTTTFMMLSESEEVHQRNFITMSTQNEDIIKKALTHLVKTTTNELEYLSAHDELTSLYNRNEYQNIFKRKIKSAERYNETFGIILLDIDHFKLVNDNYGHSTGDKVLKSFAKTLKMSLREEDLVCRWGGEEFIIIVNHMDIGNLKKLTKKIQCNIANISVNPVKNLTVSFGLTVYRKGDTEETIFKRIDQALYTAKQTGRNKYIIV